MVSHRLPAARALLGSCLLVLILSGCETGPNGAGRAARNAQPVVATEAAAEALQKATAQVVASERAFAATLANRDFKAFLTYLSPDVIFFSGSTVERGQAPIAEQWAPYFRGRRAPFSWRPDDVQVIDDGKLALSTGPVVVNGQVVGRYDSVWRLEAVNTWRIILQKGEAMCMAPPPESRSNGDQFFQNPPSNNN